MVVTEEGKCLFVHKVAPENTQEKTSTLEQIMFADKYL